MPTEKYPSIIFLPNVRLSFPHLFTAHAMKSRDGEKQQEPCFSATFLLDNTEHAALLDRIEATIERIALDEFKKKVGFKSCLRDGNEKPELDGYGDGKSFISARNKIRTGVVKRDLSPIVEEDGIIYAGCYVNATIRLWVQNNSWGKRVNAQLRAVQFVKDGESFGAEKVDASKEFEALNSDDSTGAPTGAVTRSRSRSGTGAPASSNLDDY